MAVCRAERDGVTLFVRLTPNASVDRVDGAEALADGSQVLKARVRAVPEKGRANKALVKLIAKTLDLAPSHVTVSRGLTARKKLVHIAGDPDDLIARVEHMLG